MSQNTDATCRTCLSTDKEMRSLHTTLIVSGVEVKIADILETFFNYQVNENDGFPQEVCLSCVCHLTATYSFNVMVQDSLVKLTNAALEKADSYDERPNNAASDSDSDVKPFATRPPRKLKAKASTGPQVLYCVECREKFNSALALVKHCYAYHPPKRLMGRDCDYCNEKLEDLRSLFLHRKLHTSLHVCTVCWLGFDSGEELHSHLCKGPFKEETFLEPERKMSQCDQCGKSYPVGYIKLHMRIHGTETFYSCKYCPRKFKVRCSLNSHVQWNHIKTKNHKCEICGASFITASARSAHRRKLHLKEKKHVCETCGKKFFSKSEMHRHLLTHSGEKNFHCNHCDKSYQTRYGLNVHLRSHSVT